jgi:hypothetical protein
MALKSEEAVFLKFFIFGSKMLRNMHLPLILQSQSFCLIQEGTPQMAVCLELST